MVSVNLFSSARSASLRYACVFSMVAIMLLAGPSSADTTAPGGVSADTVVLLLSHKVRSTASAVLDEGVHRWNQDSISIYVVAEKPTDLVASTLDKFQEILSTLGAAPRLRASGDGEQPEITLVYGRKSSSMFRKYKLTAEALLSIPEATIDPQGTQAIDNTMMNDDGKCLSFATTANEYQMRRVLMFVSSDRSEFLIQQCINNLMVSALGLTNAHIEGESIKATNAPSADLTPVDVTALKILYQPGVQPGDTIGKVLSQQNMITFVPHDPPDQN